VTKYQELSRLAGAHVRQLSEYRAACEGFALCLANGLADYLGCSRFQIGFHGLDERLRMTGKAVSSPELRQAEDGFIYFGLEIRLEDAGTFCHVGCLIGLKKTGDVFTVRCGDKKDFLVGESAPFFDYLADGIRESFATPAGEPLRRIGFVVGP
jgi:hypothetical protein